MNAPAAQSAVDQTELDAGPFHLKFKGKMSKSGTLVLAMVVMVMGSMFGWVLWDRMNKMDAKIDQLVFAIIGDGHGNSHYNPR